MLFRSEQEVGSWHTETVREWNFRGHRSNLPTFHSLTRRTTGAGSARPDGLLWGMGTRARVVRPFGVAFNPSRPSSHSSQRREGGPRPSGRFRGRRADAVRKSTSCSAGLARSGLKSAVLLFPVLRPGLPDPFDHPASNDSDLFRHRPVDTLRPCIQTPLARQRSPRQPRFAAERVCCER